MLRPRLGVNIDHIATLREVRQVSYPDPVDSLEILAQCDVAQVTVHLREDRRHIQDHDLVRLIQKNILPVNMELALSNDILTKAMKCKPATLTFVPEKRAELTTEGGLDVIKNRHKLQKSLKRISSHKISVSFFIEANQKQIVMSQHLGAQAIEIHTGQYADLLEKYYARYGSYSWDVKRPLGRKIERIWQQITEAACFADSLGLKVCAGHGLHVANLPPLVRVPQIREYNIGHSIVARAVWLGLKSAILEIQSVLAH